MTHTVHLAPDDVHNRTLLEHTHPSDWINPTPKGSYHLVVIGAGTAGLTSAGGCAAIGGRVALVERHLTGGDCLVTGCVPSKGIIRSARVASTVREAETYGVRVPEGVTVDFGAVMERMRRLRAQISASDSVHHLKEMGVDVFLGKARFTSRDALDVNGTTLRFSRAIIATGGRAVVPPIPGLREVGFLTNETLFELTELPKRFVMIGAGPIGCEMAQAFQRLGAQVILIDIAPQILIREDQDAVRIVQRALERDGVELVLNAKVLEVKRQGEAKIVVVEQGGHQREIACEALLVGVGRAPNLESLNLEAAWVSYDKQGAKVNDWLQTSNPRIFAAGDICSPYSARSGSAFGGKFTHTASAMGRMTMVNALFYKRLGGRASRLVIPWCTDTDPEIAHVGLYEKEAAERGIPVTTITVPLADNNRAILDGEDEGFMRAHLQKGSDRILGATVVAAHAGDLLTYFTLAMTQKKGLGSLAGAIYPYPTQSEAIKRVANQHLQTKLSPTLKRLLRGWVRLRR